MWQFCRITYSQRAKNESTGKFPANEFLMRLTFCIALVNVNVCKCTS